MRSCKLRPERRTLRPSPSLPGGGCWRRDICGSAGLGASRLSIWRLGKGVVNRGRGLQFCRWFFGSRCFISQPAHGWRPGASKPSGAVSLTVYCLGHCCPHHRPRPEGGTLASAPPRAAVTKRRAAGSSERREPTLSRPCGSESWVRCRRPGSPKAVGRQHPRHFRLLGVARGSWCPWFVVPPLRRDPGSAQLHLRGPRSREGPGRGSGS